MVDVTVFLILGIFSVAGCYIENIILVSFDMMFIRREQKQCRNCEVCRARPFFIFLFFSGRA